MVSWWYKFLWNFSVAFLFLQTTASRNLQATFREIDNPYFIVLKSITTLLRGKTLKPRIKRIEPGTWTTSCTLWLIFQRVLQTSFVGFMGNFSESLACFGDSTVFKHDLTAFKRACRVWSLHPRFQSTKSGS